MTHLAIRRRATRFAAPVLALAVWGCSSSSGPVETPIPAPTVTALDRASAAPGDTVTITGTNFNATANLNRVTFNNALAVVVPVDGSTTELRAVVPTNAADGPVSVTVPGAGSAVGPDLAITRGIGDVWTWGGPGDVDQPTPAGAEYLLVPYAGSASVPVTQDNPYSVSAAGLPPVAAPQNDTAADAAAPQWSSQAAFESERWRAAAKLFDEAGAPARRVAPEAAAPSETAQFRQFNVYNTTSGSLIDPSNYTQVTAEMRYSGQHCLIYTDVDTMATGNLTYANLRDFANTFDNEIHVSNTTYFGTESDIDGNGKVIILITRVVNHLTPKGSNSFIGGFFLPVDLYAAGGSIPSGTTNHAEMFYVLAADTEWDSRFTASFVAQEDLRTIVHEYQHLISYSYRLFHFGATAVQQTWLEEGMAHMAEDLLAHYSGDASFNDSNAGRANLYLANPGGVSLEWDESPVDQRGGIYLFLRLLGDRFGTGIYKQILQSDCLGRGCIEKVTGESFYNTIGEFLAALYLSGKGITTNPRFNYTSISLGALRPVTIKSRGMDGTLNNDSTHRAGGDLYRFINPTQTTTRFTLSTTNSQMGLRTVFVRIK